MSPVPLGYLTAAGQRAQAILGLTWYTLIVSIVVCVVIALVLWMAVRRAQGRGGAAETRAVPLQREAGSTHWIKVGLALSAVPLIIALVWTMVTLGAVAEPSSPAGLVIEVTGHQWWWEVRYDAPQPDRIFTTANEIHIPVNTRVQVLLRGADVIHSFWVPQLTGKTDTIPGQTNVSWLEARRPGRYLGQCTEYCGWQHSHMRLEVVAENPPDFERWRSQQLQPAPPPANAAQAHGQELVEFRCGLCHQVRGTGAASHVGPDLTHLESRRTIAAGVLTNQPGNLAAWIEAAQTIKPGTLMPNQGLPAQQLQDVVAYLESLK